jgi:ABC-type transport system substrate-binding protein
MAVAGFNWGVTGEQIIMFGCESVPPAGFNRMGYCNPEYDELENQARVELDPQARIDLLIEASNIVNDEAVVGIMVFRKSIVGSGPRMHNFIPNGYSTVWSLSKVWVDAS